MTGNKNNSEDTAFRIYLREIMKIPLLSKEEEIGLVLKVKEGDENAKKRLAESNLRFVVSCAKHYSSNIFPLEDLVNEGNIGLMKAVEEFNPSFGKRFVNYAIWWIKQSILKYMIGASTVRFPENLVGRIRKINKDMADFTERGYSEIEAMSEVAKIYHMTPKKLKDILDLSTFPISLNLPAFDDGEKEIIDIIPADYGSFEELAEYNELRKEVEIVLKSLTEREKEMIRLRYGLLDNNPKLLAEVGERYSLTRERVRQVQGIALQKLRRRSQRLRSYL